MPRPASTARCPRRSTGSSGGRRSRSRRHGAARRRRPSRRTCARGPAGLAPRAGSCARAGPEDAAQPGGAELERPREALGEVAARSLVAVLCALQQAPSSARVSGSGSSSRNCRARERGSLIDAHSSARMSRAPDTDRGPRERPADERRRPRDPGLPLRAARARLRPPGIPQQDRARAERRRRRAAAARADARLLRLLRLALVGARALAARAPGPRASRMPPSPARRARALAPEPDAGEHRRRGPVSRGQGPRDLRAAVRARVAAAARGGAARVGTIPRRAAGRTRSRRSSERRPRASATGCPSSRSRSGSASTTQTAFAPRPDARLGAHGRGLGDWQTLVVARSRDFYRGGPRLSARRTSRRARTSCRPASARPT